MRTTSGCAFVLSIETEFQFWVRKGGELAFCPFAAWIVSTLTRRGNAASVT